MYDNVLYDFYYVGMILDNLFKEDIQSCDKPYRYIKCCACHEVCTSRFTCGSPDKALCRKNASKDSYDSTIIADTKTQLSRETSTDF